MTSSSTSPNAAAVFQSTTLSIAVLLALSLSGCGGGGSDQVNTAPLQSGSDSTPQPVVVPDDTQLPATTTVAAASYTGEYAAFRADAFQRLNDARSASGLGLLTQEPRLDSSAQWHSDKRYQKHENPYDASDKDLATRVSRFGYPPLNERPSSQYSQKTTSLPAIKELLASLAQREVSAIITFPDHECSNGIDASMIKSAASVLFKVKTQSVTSVFSTLGGPASKKNGPRLARLSADEMILCLEPK